MRSSRDGAPRTKFILFPSPSQISIPSMPKNSFENVLNGSQEVQIFTVAAQREVKDLRRRRLFQASTSFHVASPMVSRIVPGQPVYDLSTEHERKAWPDRTLTLKAIKEAWAASHGQKSKVSKYLRSECHSQLNTNVIGSQMSRMLKSGELTNFQAAAGIAPSVLFFSHPSSI
jgi:hypothetical protein